jgi:hypothetical protein
MATLGQHVVEKAADELQRRPGHGLPVMILGILVAEADVAVLDRDNPALGQRDAVDRPAQVMPHLLRAVHRGVTVDHPAFGPRGLGQGAVGPFLTA